MRVISLLPAATEIVALLGASEHLVGITHECDYPDIVASRARVTATNIAQAADATEIDRAVRDAHDAGAALFSLDEPLIRALRPDVIITQALCDVCAVSETDVRALAATLSPSPSIVTLDGSTIDGILRDVGKVGTALHEAQNAAQSTIASDAEELLLGLADRMRHVHDTLRQAKAPRPRVVLIEWSSPLYIAGHWAPEQIRRAGGTDVLGTAGAHSATVEMSALERAAPEIVLFAPCGYSLERAAAEVRALLGQPSWHWMRDAQVWALDANALVSRPGPRVVDGIEAMARIFNPMLFSPIDPKHATRVR